MQVYNGLLLLFQALAKGEILLEKKEDEAGATATDAVVEEKVDFELCRSKIMILLSHGLMG